jgi:hypothetical protein
MKKKIPLFGAIEKAKKFPNGYIYEIDKAFEGEENIPPNAIVGAWKVNGKGEIVGDFIPNPNYLEVK